MHKSSVHPMLSFWSYTTRDAVYTALERSDSDGSRVEESENRVRLVGPRGPVQSFSQSTDGPPRSEDSSDSAREPRRDRGAGYSVHIQSHGGANMLEFIGAERGPLHPRRRSGRGCLPLRPMDAHPP